MQDSGLCMEIMDTLEDLLNEDSSCNADEKESVSATQDYPDIKSMGLFLYVEEFATELGISEHLVKIHTERDRVEKRP